MEEYLRKLIFGFFFVRMGFCVKNLKDGLSERGKLFARKRAYLVNKKSKI
jgi:hypothetical protein